MLLLRCQSAVAGGSVAHRTDPCGRTIVSGGYSTLVGRRLLQRTVVVIVTTGVGGCGGDSHQTVIAITIRQDDTRSIIQLTPSGAQRRQVLRHFTTSSPVLSQLVASSKDLVHG